MLVEIPGSIYDKCICEGYFPTEWKSARIVVLPKSTDKVWSDSRSYRGISLIPVLGKVLEKVEVERLQELVRDSISDRQYSFRKGRSIEDAWMIAQNVVRSSNFKYVLGVFIESKGAFDYQRGD